jgi:hypothetical protein
VVHLVAYQLADLSADLASVGARDAAFPLPHGPWAIRSPMAAQVLTRSSSSSCAGLSG